MQNLNNLEADIKIKFKTIKNIGKDLACILSPTIISGDVSSWSEIPMIIIEKTVRNNGIV